VIVALHNVLIILQNVLLTKDDPPIVKVADFGLAKAVRDDETMLRVSEVETDFVFDAVNRSSRRCVARQPTWHQR